MNTLLDELLPDYDVELTEAVTVPALPDAVMNAVHEVTPAEMPMARVLNWVRTLGVLKRERHELNVPLEELIKRFGWLRLGEVPHREIVQGVAGQLWRRDFGVVRLQNAASFRGFAEPGYAKVAVSYRVEPAADGTRLVCETRVHCTDEVARRRFNWYWRVIGLGARLTVRSDLNAIRNRALNRAA